MNRLLHAAGQFLCFLLLIALPICAMAQDPGTPRIEGRVVDAASGSALEGVHVFVSRSTRGTVTDRFGRFGLDIPVGAHRLVVSRVGYVTQTHDVMIRHVAVYGLDVALTEDLVALEGITVTDSRDPAWDGYLKRFRDDFLGTTPNARQVEILNPEVLDFTEEDGVFRAYASGPIELENRALGYHVTHHLHDFAIDGDRTWQDGESYFTELDPSSADQARQWEAARERAFRGSVPHFFLSLIRQRTREQGFVTYIVDSPTTTRGRALSQSHNPNPIRQPFFAVDPARYLSPGADANEHVLAFPKFMHVVYTEEPEDPAYKQWQVLDHTGPVRDMQYSWLALESGSVTIDDEGYAVDPYATAYFGYMAFERLADLLPKEYRPRTFR